MATYHYERYLAGIVGQRFGRWTVRSIGAMESRTRRVTAECDCGTIRDVFLNGLKKGATRSCGCLQKELASKVHRQHGASFSRTYGIWKYMWQRCTNPNHSGYHNYGGRGITVCERWKSFQNFRDDMGAAPDNLCLERINNDGNYEPGNCRWATMIEQRGNTRFTPHLTWNGRTQTLMQWARELNIRPVTLRGRLYTGWTVAEALSLPASHAVRKPRWLRG